MDAVSQELFDRFSFLKERPSLDCPAVDCPQNEVLEFLRSLKDEFGYQFLTDITAIDYYETSPRFVVVYHLYQMDKGVYLRVATPCDGDSKPACVSATSLWPAADWHERETYDMFGIHFIGHPDLRRILMWEGYPHYPLRKEFPLAGEEVEIPAPDLQEQTGVTAQPAPMMGGPFHSAQRGSMAQREPRADDESWNEKDPRDPKLPKPSHPRDFKQSDI